MGFDNDCILNIQSLAGEYFCPVCHLLVYPNEALQTQCTHLYCKPCLTYIVSSTHACPYDGYRVTEAETKPLLESNKALADTIWKIQVHCLYYRTGCTWQGPLSDSTSHCSTCAFGESPVQCNRCGIQIVHRQVQEHAHICPGVQSQSRSVVGQNVASSGLGPVLDQGQSVNQTVAPASQTQGTEASASSSSTQDTNQQANPSLQPQLAQAAMPTPEQWYQQQQQYQQQYQQYYQQYPGYDPYQQQYQYYYQYPQPGQPSQQPATQTYQPHVYGQAQAQVQAQTQQQGQSHVQPRSQMQPQAPSQALQLQVQPQAQPTVITQPQVQSAVQAQSQMQAPNQGPPSNVHVYNQSQLLPQAQQQPVPQQAPVPQHQQPHPQMPHTYPQPYPQSQTQNYHHLQHQAQPHSQVTAQAAVYQTSQVNQPLNTNAQLPAQGGVSGFQSYPQQLPSQAQVGAPQQIPSANAMQQPLHHGQMQGQFPPQASQIRPLQPYGVVAHQQQSTVLSAQGQAPTGPPAQPGYPYTQQAGYAFHQRLVVQQQLHPQVPSQVQPQLPPQQQPQQNCAPPHTTQPNMAQSYAGKQMIPLGSGSQPYALGSGPTGPGHVRATQSQAYPLGTDSQLATSQLLVGHAQNSSKTASSERPSDLMVEKGTHCQNDHNEEAREVAGASAVGSHVDEINKVKSENNMEEFGRKEIKRDTSLPSAGDLPGSKQVPGTHLKSVEAGVQEYKSVSKENTAGEISEPISGDGTDKGRFEDGKDVKKAGGQVDRGKVATSASVLPQSHLIPQVPGSNSFPLIDQGRNQLQPLYYGPSDAQRPGLSSIAQSTPIPGNFQQGALHGNISNQLRPQAPGQVPPRPPLHATDTQPALKNPPGAVPHENPSGSSLGPCSSGSVGRSGSVSHYQGQIPAYQTVQPQNSQGENFSGSSNAAQRPSAFDSHGSMMGRELLPRCDVQQRPPYAPELEKFPVQRPSYFDNRLPDSNPHALMEQGRYGPVQPGVHSGAMKFSGPLSHEPMHASRIHGERYRPFLEEYVKPFAHRDLENDFRNSLRPSQLETGPSKFGTDFPSSRPLDQVPLHFGADGLSRGFEKGPHGLEHRSGLKMDAGSSSFLPALHPNDLSERARTTGFPDDIGRPASSGILHHGVNGLAPRSPGRDYGSFPPRSFGGRNIDGNELRSFEGSKPYSFYGVPHGKSAHDIRFPVPPNHLPRGEINVSGNLRMGDYVVGGPHNQDMLPGHVRRGEPMGPHNSHLRDGAAFGRSAGPLRIGERPLAGNLPQHIAFDDSFGDKPGHPVVGEPGYRGSYSYQRYARDSGFFLGEMEPFDYTRRRKPGSIMCRICKVECGTVEGLDLHSQSKDHQRKAMDMVLSIKQQNKKKKTSKDQASVEAGRDGGKPKASSFESCGNKR